MLTFNTLDDFANLLMINLMEWNKRFLRKVRKRLVDLLKTKP